MQKTLGTFLPPGMEDVGRKNMAMMERAMTLFTPFYSERDPEDETEVPNEVQEEIVSLREEVERLQQQLAAARAKPKKE
jgi:polyhydroxyalkanoate synthesis regulator protein